MKINITKDDGEVLEVIEAQDIGDLDKPLARADLMTTIRDVWMRDGGVAHGARSRARTVNEQPKAGV